MRRYLESLSFIDYVIGILILFILLLFASMFYKPYTEYGKRYLIRQNDHIADCLQYKNTKFEEIPGRCVSFYLPRGGKGIPYDRYKNKSEGGKR